MRVEDSQLKAFLLDTGRVLPKDIKEAEKEAKKTNQKLEKVLLKKKIINEEELIRLKAYILGIPFVDLKKEIVPKEILYIIPEPLARKHNIVAFRKKGNELEVAMLDPEDLQTIEFIKKKTGLKILPRLTNKESIKNVLTQYQKTLEAEFSELIKKEGEKISPIIEKEKEETKEELEKAAEQLPIVRITDAILKHAILQHASDIHIEPLEKETLIRYRIDGILHDAMILPCYDTSQESSFRYSG